MIEIRAILYFLCQLSCLSRGSDVKGELYFSSMVAPNVWRSFFFL
jgi:hypothetical protein